MVNISAINTKFPFYIFQSILSFLLIVNLVIIFQVCGIAVPFAILVITKKKILQLDFKPELMKKYGMLVDEFTFYNTFTRCYYVFFFTRRFIFAIITCLPSAQQVLQLILNLLFSSFVTLSFNIFRTQLTCFCEILISNRLRILQKLVQKQCC